MTVLKIMEGDAYGHEFLENTTQSNKGTDNMKHSNKVLHLEQIKKPSFYHSVVCLAGRMKGSQMLMKIEFSICVFRSMNGNIIMK